MQIPDVTGHLLKDARSLLEKAGIKQIDILMTTPPKLKGRLPDENARVVRQKHIENDTIVKLVVCDPNC